MSEPAVEAMARVMHEANRKAFADHYDLPEWDDCDEGEQDYWLSIAGEGVTLIRAQIVDEVEAKIEEELHHAEDNDHYLAEECQGVETWNTGQKEPAVRISSVRAAFEGYRRANGMIE